MESVNFVTAHDGFTLYDLVSYDHRHNEANGWDNTDGHHDNRSWNCGWEGDDGVPDSVLELRDRQMRNAMCMLLLAHGVPMFVAGDEFARTQGGNNNPYNQDNETSWIDWDRAEEFADLERFVRRLIEIRSAHPVLWDPHRWGDLMVVHGADGAPDLSYESRSIAWSRRRALRDGQHVVGAGRVRGAAAGGVVGRRWTPTIRGRRRSAAAPDRRSPSAPARSSSSRPDARELYESS